MANEKTEQKFRHLFKDRKDVWIWKLQVLFGATPFDYLVLAPQANYAVEVKEWKEGKYWRVSERVAKHQIVGLRRFSLVGPNFKSYFFVNVKGVGMFFIPAEELIKYENHGFKIEEFVNLFQQYQDVEVL